MPTKKNIKNSSNIKSSKVLVSFCNVFPRDLALGVFDYDRDL